MKKINNYGITYFQKTVDGSNKVEEIYYTKKNMLTRYLNILDGKNPVFAPLGIGSISGLKCHVTYANTDFGTEDITSKINLFIRG